MGEVNHGKEQSFIEHLGYKLPIIPETFDSFKFNRFWKDLDNTINTRTTYYEAEDYQSLVDSIQSEFYWVVDKVPELVELVEQYEEIVRDYQRLIEDLASEIEFRLTDEEKADWEIQQVKNQLIKAAKG